SPQGDRVLTASRDGEARVWETGTGKLLVSLPHHGWIHHAAFSPDGRRVVTASTDRTARVWDALTGEPLTPPLRHSSAVLDASFSPDGLRVVTTSRDQTARVWDLPHPDRAPQDLRLLAELLAGERVDSSGAVLRSEPARRHDIWQKLRATYSATFGASPT